MSQLYPPSPSVLIQTVHLVKLVTVNHKQV